MSLKTTVAFSVFCFLLKIAQFTEPSICGKISNKSSFELQLRVNNNDNCKQEGDKYVRQNPAQSEIRYTSEKRDNITVNIKLYCIERDDCMQPFLVSSFFGNK